eukprot:g14349.t1
MISNEQGQVQAPYGTTSAGGRFNSYGMAPASGRYDHNASRLSDSASVNTSNSQSTMNSYYGGPGTTTTSSAMKSSTYNPAYGAYSQPRPLPAPPPPPANFKVSANPTASPKAGFDVANAEDPRKGEGVAGISQKRIPLQWGDLEGFMTEPALRFGTGCDPSYPAQRETPLTHAELNLVKKCGNTLRALQVLDFEGKEFVGLFFPRDNYVDLVNYSILYTAAMRNAACIEKSKQQPLCSAAGSAAPAPAVTTVATISATANLELVKPNQIAALSAHTTGKLLECDQYEASESDMRWTTFCATALVELSNRRAHQSATQVQELARLREQQLRNLRNGYAVHKNLCHNFIKGPGGGTHYHSRTSYGHLPSGLVINFVPADVQYCVQLIQHLYRTIHADDRDPQVARRFVWLANTIHATLQEDSGSVLSLLQSYRDHFFGNRRVETYGRELTELVVDHVHLLPHEAQQVAALLLLDAIRPKTNLCLGLHVFFQLAGYFECVQMSETAAKIAEVGYRHCLVGAPSGHAILKNSGNGAGGKKVLVGGLQHHLVNVNRGNHSGSPLISPHFQQIPPVAASETSNVIAVVGRGRGSSTSPSASTGGTGAPGDHVESDCDFVVNNTNTNYTRTSDNMIQLDAVSKLRASCSRGFQRPGILFPLTNRHNNCFDANGTLITPGNLAEDFGKDWISELETTGYQLIKRELAAWERKHYAYSDSVALAEDHSDFGKNAFAAATRTSTGEKNSTSPPLLKYNNMLGAKKFCRTDPDATQYEDVGGSHRVSGQTDSNVLGTGRWREIVLFNGTTGGEVALSSGGDSSCKNANYFLHSTTVEFQAGKVAADPPFQSVEQKKLEKKKRVDDYKRQLFGDPSLSNRNTTLNCLSQHPGTSTRSSGILDQNGNPTGRHGNNGQPQSGSKHDEVDPRVDQLHDQQPGGMNSITNTSMSNKLNLLQKANASFSQQPEGVCAIRVGQDWKQWEQGKVLLFDDSFEHEVVNKTPERRVILLIRFWHPQIDSRSLEELDRPPLEKLEKIKAAEKKKLEKALQEKIEEIHSGQVWKAPGAGGGQQGEVLAEKKKTTEHKIKEQEKEDETPASVAAASAAAATDAAAAVKAGLQRVLKYLMEVVKSHRLRLLPDEKLTLQQLQMRTRNPEDHNKKLVSDLRVFLLSLVERLEGGMEAAASLPDVVFDTLTHTQEEANRSPEKTKQTKQSCTIQFPPALREPVVKLHHSTYMKWDDYLFNRMQYELLTPPVADEKLERILFHLHYWNHEQCEGVLDPTNEKHARMLADSSYHKCPICRTVLPPEKQGFDACVAYIAQTKEGKDVPNLVSGGDLNKGPSGAAGYTTTTYQARAAMSLGGPILSSEGHGASRRGGA